MANGSFIALEGIDGSGKSTLRDSLAAWLREKTGKDVITASEPKREGQGVWATEIRGMLKGDKQAPKDPLEFQRLYIFDRAEDVYFLIHPQLQRGNFVLYDRYALSTLAYGMLSDLSIERLIKLHEEIIGPMMIYPHLNIILDLDPKISLSRKSGQYDKPEFFEKADSLQKIRDAYLTVAKHPRFASSTIVVDASRSPDIVFNEVKEKLAALL